MRQLENSLKGGAQNGEERKQAEKGLEWTHSEEWAGGRVTGQSLWLFPAKVGQGRNK